MIDPKRKSAKIDENANVDLSRGITEPPVTKASAEQLTSHTADGNKLCVTVIHDVTVWLDYAAKAVDQLESMLEGSDSSTQAAINSQISELYNKAQTWQNKKAVAELGLDASKKLEDLLHYNESKTAWTKPPVCKNQNHHLFKKGTTTSNVTQLRLLLKVDLLWNMLRRGELQDKGVVFDISLAEKIDKEVYFIKAGENIYL